MVNQVSSSDQNAQQQRLKIQQQKQQEDGERNVRNNQPSAHTNPIQDQSQARHENQNSAKGASLDVRA